MIFRREGHYSFFCMFRKFERKSWVSRGGMCRVCEGKEKTF